MFVGSSGHAAGKIISFFKMKKSHYSSCQPSSPRSSFPFVLFFASCRFIGHTPFFNLTPVSFFSFLAFCHKQATSQRDYIPPTQTAPFSFSPCRLLSSFPPSTHLSINSSHTLSPLYFPLISLPMLWFVSPVSVRAVITAVSSFGENKVVLCSQHHKRHERNERKRASAPKKGKQN